MMKVVFHIPMNRMTGEEVPLYIRHDGRWQQAATGIYDAKNKFVTIEFDPDTVEGLLITDMMKQQYVINNKAVSIEIDGKTMDIEELGNG